MDAKLQERSIQEQPSETAMATATMRAMAAYDEREEIRGTDTLAEIFLSEDRKAPLKDKALRQWVMKNKVAPGAYEFMLARTAFFDQIVKNALLQNLPQVVILGAGYDSRPYRFKDLVRGTHIFELDAPPTQLRKKEALEGAGIARPENLAYVPIDFNRDDLEEVLPAAGFLRDRQSLFLWEGVTYYLPAQSVDHTLHSIRSVSLPGSSICFDYACLSTDALGEEGVVKLRSLMKSDHPDEPTKFGIPLGRLEPFMAERGYSVIEHISSTEMEKRYLTLKDGSIVGKVPALFAFVHAVTI